MEKTIICIGREYGSGGHASERFLQNVPGMNSMIKNVSLQLQRTCNDVRKMIEEKIHVRDVIILDTKGISSMYASDGGIIVSI